VVYNLARSTMAASKNNLAANSTAADNHTMVDCMMVARSCRSEDCMMVRNKQVVSTSTTAVCTMVASNSNNID